MRSLRTPAVVAMAATAALAIAACGSSGGSTASSSNGKVTLTWWNNATAGPLKGVWQQVAACVPRRAPERHDPGRADPERALHDQDPACPAVQQPAGHLPAVGRRPGGHAGPVRQGHEPHQATLGWIGQLGSAAAGLAGRTASSTASPTTCTWWASGTARTCSPRPASPPRRRPDRALTPMYTKLKAAHIVPIAVGSKDKWPDAFWWEYFALRDCSTATLKAAMKAINLTDPCFLKAGDDLQTLHEDQAVPDRFPRHPVAAGRGQLGGHGRQRQGRDGTAG